MASLTTAELDQMRLDAETVTMPDTCRIDRVLTTVEAGEALQGTANIATAAPCRLAKSGLRPFMRNIRDATLTDADWTLTLHHDQDVAERDTITVNSQTLYVTKVWTDQSFNVATRCDLKEVE